MGSPTPRYERSPRPSALFPPLAPVEFPSLVPANGQSVRCVASVVRTDSVRQNPVPTGFGWLAGNSKRDHESTKVRNHERRGGDGRFIRPRVFVRSCFRDCFGSEPKTPCLVPPKPFAALRLGARSLRGCLAQRRNIKAPRAQRSRRRGRGLPLYPERVPR